MFTLTATPAQLETKAAELRARAYDLRNPGTGRIASDRNLRISDDLELEAQRLVDLADVYAA